MNQDFQWGNPYDDLGAENVQDGDVSYYNFDWDNTLPNDDAVNENNARAPQDQAEEQEPEKSDRYDMVQE